VVDASYRTRFLETLTGDISAMTAVIEKSIGAALIALTLIGSGYPMTAKAMGPAPQSVGINAGITIRFADLDLSKPAGIATLYGRISRAARDICGPSGADGDGRMSLKERCITRTIEDAVTRINRPLLTALHSEHLKHTQGS
jgi:UrcA family protein